MTDCWATSKRALDQIVKGVSRLLAFVFKCSLTIVSECFLLRNIGLSVCVGNAKRGHRRVPVPIQDCRSARISGYTLFIHAIVGEESTPGFTADARNSSTKMDRIGGVGRVGGEGALNGAQQEFALSD